MAVRRDIQRIKSFQQASQVVSYVSTGATLGATALGSQVGVIGAVGAIAGSLAAVTAGVGIVAAAAILAYSAYASRKAELDARRQMKLKEIQLIQAHRTERAAIGGYLAARARAGVWTPAEWGL